MKFLGHHVWKKNDGIFRVFKFKKERYHVQLELLNYEFFWGATYPNSL